MNQDKLKNLQNRYGEFANYAIRLFDHLNGRINNVFVANKLIFSTASEQRQPANVLGRSVLGTIIIHLADLFIFCSRNKFDDDDQVRGFILQTVAHELSHCDQSIDFLAISENQKELNLMEDANNANTLIYIKNHYDELQQLGLYDINPTCLTRPTPNVEETAMHYHQIKHPNEKILALLEFLTPENPIDILNTKYLELNYIMKSGERMHRPIIMNWQWTPVADNLDILTHMFSNQDTLAVYTNYDMLTKCYNMDVHQTGDGVLYPMTSVPIS